MRDTGEKIIERCTGWNHGGKLCKCSRCEMIRRASFDFDFYAKEDGDPLFCEKCFRDDLKTRGVELGKGFKPLEETTN